MQIVSTATMIRRLVGMLGTRDLSDWEQGFVESLAEKLDAGHVTQLTERQVETLDRLHRKHFGG
jgi:hypothetical protein